MNTRIAQQLQSEQTPSDKRRKTLFSNVGSDVVENIISFLPIKEATKLSILSNRFRHSWKFCRNLCFDRSVSENLSNDEFKTLVNNFFLHKLITKADKFTLRFHPTNEDDTQQMNQWIQQAAALSVTELELDLRTWPNNNASFSINHSLIGRVVERLKLVNCEIQLQITYGYFHHLRELIFHNTLISQASLGFMLLNSPLLTSLELVSCSFALDRLIISAHDLKWFRRLVVFKCLDIDWISIDAPLLSSFHYHGKMIEFEFPNNVFRLLNDAVIHIIPSKGFKLLPHRNDVMFGLSFVQKLSISSAFLEGFSSRFEESIDHIGSRVWILRLKEFNLDVSTESIITPKDIVEFLKKCSDIENLKVELANNSFKNSLYWDVHGRRYMTKTTLSLTLLKTIKMTGFTYNELPVTMARFFLQNVQQLQDLILVKGKRGNFPAQFTPDRLRHGLSPSSNAVNIEVIEYRINTNNE